MQTIEKNRTGGKSLGDAVTTPPLAVSVADAVKMTGLGRSTIYSVIAEGLLPMRKCGSRSLLAVADIERFVAGLPLMKSSAKAGK